MGGGGVFVWGGRFFVGGGGMEKICKVLDREGGGGDTAGTRGLQAGNVSHTAIGAPDCPGDFAGGAHKISDAA